MPRVILGVYIQAGNIGKLIQGDEVDLMSLSSCADQDHLRKLYKVTPEELQVGSLLDAIVGRIAAKGNA